MRTYILIFKEEAMLRRRIFCLLLVVTFALVPLGVAFAGGEKEVMVEEPEPAITIEVTGSQVDRAVALGKQFKGTTLTLLYEGIQAGAIKLFAPNWEKLTGMKVRVVEVPFEELVQKAITEHEAGTGAFDIMLTSYSWVPDYVESGVCIPIDRYVEKYMTEEDLADIEPGHRIAMMYYKDKLWGMPADGDLFILYYREDLFNDEGNKAAFKSRYGYDLMPPKTWKQYNEIGQFLTDRYNGEIYGGASQRGAGQAFYFFAQVFLGLEGEWFDMDTMKSTINSPTGVKAMEQLVKSLKFGPPGMEKWGAVELWSAYLEGKLGMLYSFPPIGRFAEAVGGIANYPTWLPMTKVPGKTNYALLPGPSAQMTAPWIWTISSDSKNKDAAFAFEMWFSSPEISIQICTLPNSLIDPHRFSHYDSPYYRSLWPNAGNYLDTLREAGKYATLDLKMIGGTEYQDAVDRAVTAVMGGMDIKQALDQGAAKMDEITKRLGKDRAKESYSELVKLQEEVRRLAQ
jgi:multiple sugar transport system substrate-binding protein